VGQGTGVSNIEISDKNIKSFESVARKYGVDYALKKDASGDTPKWLVFFKGRDDDATLKTDCQSSKIRNRQEGIMAHGWAKIKNLHCVKS